MFTISHIDYSDIQLSLHVTVDITKFFIVITNSLQKAGDFGDLSDG